MGQTCTGSREVAEDGKGFSGAAKGKGKSAWSRSKLSAAGKAAKPEGTHHAAHHGNAECETDTPPKDTRTPSPGHFTVVTKIEALQHTMRPTIPVVGRMDLHPEFRQFTPIFAKGYAATAVVSCHLANLQAQVLMSSEDCTIAQFAYETGHVMRRWVRAHNKVITCLTRPVSTGLFASCGRDAAVRVWSLNRDTPIAELLGHTADVVSVDVDPGCTSIVSGGKDSTVRLWDIGQATELCCIDAGNNNTTFVRFLPQLNLFAQGGEDGAVRLWDVRLPPDAPSLTLHSSLNDTDHTALCADISPSVYTRLITGHSGDGEQGASVLEWDLRQSALARTYTGHKGDIVSLRMTTSEEYGDSSFFTTSRDGTMGYWAVESYGSDLDVATLPIEHQFKVPEGVMTCCECTTNGDIVVTLQSGSAVVFRPENQGATTTPAKRFRYIGTMDEAKSLFA